MTSDDHQNEFSAEAYDAEAVATGWLGPEIVFGLAYRHVQPGQTILDIGIGTGLGSILFHRAGLQVYGLDQSPQMLAAARAKGFAADLLQHDLTRRPYPYADRSLDHAVCTGVMNFFADLGMVFTDVARILRRGGVFVFVVGDRREGDPPAFTVGPEHTKTDADMTMYRHATEQIAGWAGAAGFAVSASLEFMAYMDHEKQKKIPSRAYLAIKR